MAKVYVFFTQTHFHLNCFGFSFLAASVAISAILFCLVSGRLASTSHCKILFLTDLLKLKKKFFESGLVLNSLPRSFGIFNSSTSSNIIHEPFPFAVSILSKPAWVISPSSVSRRTFSLFIFDQVPFDFLLLKNCMNFSSSKGFLLLSTHPKHSASSTAPLQPMVGLFDSFLYKRSQMDCFDLWFFFNHCLQSC